MPYIKRSLISLFFFFVGMTVQAQEIDPTAKEQSFDVKIESAGTFTDGDFAPFWLTNNKFGIASEKTNNGYMRVGAFGYKSFLNNNVKVSVGADALVAHNLQSDAYIQQLYADFQYWNVAMSIGMKERDTRFRNNDLSTGGMSLSRNARPIPQVEVGIPHFVDVPFTKGVLQVQGGFSYGFFTDNNYREKHAGDGNYVKNVLHHRKELFVKVEKPNSNWNLILGLEMGTQWGGDVYEGGVHTTTNPHKLSDAFRVLVNASGSKNAHQADQDNKLGDGYGSYHIIYNHKLKESSFKFYYEHFFEDRSGVEFMNVPDGTYGFEFDFNKKQLVSKILIEYVHTKDQSGVFNKDSLGNSITFSPASAEDNYYNNGLYVSLMNNGHVLGNPLLVSPLYNKGTTLKLANNRISAFHAGMSGYFTNDLSYRLLLTYSRAYGVPGKRMDTKDHISSMLEVNYTNTKLNGWQFGGALAYDDARRIVGDNIGFQLKVSKQFNIIK